MLRTTVLLATLLLIGLQAQAQRLPDRIITKKGDTISYYKLTSVSGYLIGLAYKDGELKRRDIAKPRIQLFEQNVVSLTNEERVMLEKQLANRDTSRRWLNMPRIAPDTSHTVAKSISTDPESIYRAVQIRLGVGVAGRTSITDKNFVDHTLAGNPEQSMSGSLTTLACLTGGMRAMAGHFTYGLLYNGMLGNKGHNGGRLPSNNSVDQSTSQFDRLALHYLAPDLGFFFGNSTASGTLTFGAGPLYYTESFRGPAVPETQLSNLTLGGHLALSGYASISRHLGFFGELVGFFGSSTVMAYGGSTDIDHSRLSLSVGMAWQLND